MPLSIGSGSAVEAHKLHNDSPWVWLAELHLTDVLLIRVTDNTEAVSRNGSVYFPAAWTPPTVQEALGINTQTMNIPVMDPDDSLASRLKDGEIRGQEVRLSLIHYDFPDEDVVEYKLRVLGAAVDDVSATVIFTVGRTNVLQQTMGRRALRDGCMHPYGGVTCGYDAARSGAMASCTQLFEGTNGCIEHGADEASVGLQNKHPRRFGAFPGLPASNRG